MKILGFFMILSISSNLFAKIKVGDCCELSSGGQGTWRCRGPNNEICGCAAEITSSSGSGSVLNIAQTLDPKFVQCSKPVSAPSIIKR